MKAPTSIVVTSFGISIEIKDEQPAKVSSPIVVKLSERTTDFKEEHS